MDLYFLSVVVIMAPFLNIQKSKNRHQALDFSTQIMSPSSSQVYAGNEKEVAKMLIHSLQKDENDVFIGARKFVTLKHVLLATLCISICGLLNSTFTIVGNVPRRSIDDDWCFSLIPSESDLVLNCVATS